jgi:hypothetical protein
MRIDLQFGRTSGTRLVQSNAINKRVLQRNTKSLMVICSTFRGWWLPVRSRQGR